MDNTLIIVGAGRSLCDIPQDHVFGHDTMALNVSTIAPQFYDHKTETFHHSWTYACYIDAAVKNKMYFPEYYYWQKAINNKSGVVFIPNRPQHWGMRISPNVFYADIPKSYKTVLLAALKIAKNRDYEKVILVGCDFCRTGLYRYWWETEDWILNHPLNENAQIKAKRETYTERKSGKVQVHSRIRHFDCTVTEYTEDSGGNKVLCDDTYKRQIKTVVNLIYELSDDNFTVFKYKDVGMLEIPVIDNLEEL